MALEDSQKKFIGYLGGGILALAIVLVACSFSILPATHVGLDYNTVTQFIDPTMHQGGRYFLGLGHMFLAFPKTLQLIEFSDSVDATRAPLDCSSREGQGIQIQCSFYYRLKPEQINDIYLSYKFDYHERIADIATSVLKNVAASNYNTLDFFNQRREISLEMQRNLEIALVNVSSVPFFQLRNIGIPQGFEDAQVNKLVAAQANRLEEIKRDAIITRATTDVLVEEKNALIRVIQMEAQGEAEALAADWVAKGEKALEEALGDGLREMKTSLNLTDAQMEKLYWLQTMSKRDGDTVMVGMDSMNTLDLSDMVFD